MICTFIFYGVIKHTYKLIVQEACNLCMYVTVRASHVVL